MFTGIIEYVGAVASISALNLAVQVKDGPTDWVIGESVAINGCCLTVVGSDPNLLFDVSPETLSRTSLGDLKPGSLVNIERAMQIGSRFGGHIVQGHVDGTGEVLSVKDQDNARIFKIKVPTQYSRYMIDKGSITVDGISLTVVKPKDAVFQAWIIPHTLAETNLSSRKVGDRVNLEFDVVARYVENLLGPKTPLSDFWRSGGG